MPSQKQIVTMLDGHAFEQIEDPGFVAFIRRHPADGRKQWLRFFWWSNPKRADKQRIPRAYLVVIPGLDHDLDHGEGERFRLPLVYWPDEETERVPAAQQKMRAWKDVAAEFHDVFMPALDAPYPHGRTVLDALGGRYRLT